jgi:hypothetical protein
LSSIISLSLSKSGAGVVDYHEPIFDVDAKQRILYEILDRLDDIEARFLVGAGHVRVIAATILYASNAVIWANDARTVDLHVGLFLVGHAFTSYPFWARLRRFWVHVFLAIPPGVLFFHAS